MRWKATPPHQPPLNSQNCVAESTTTPAMEHLSMATVWFGVKRGKLGIYWFLVRY